MAELVPMIYWYERVRVSTVVMRSPYSSCTTSTTAQILYWYYMYSTLFSCEVCIVVQNDSTNLTLLVVLASSEK